MSRSATKTRSEDAAANSEALEAVAPESAHPEPSSLSGYITERFETFSRSQKDVARYIVDHLDEAAFQTAEELARRASTSSSTVVRFSQALGFEGYPELQQAAIEEYRRGNGGEATPAPLFSLDQSDVEGALAADHGNIEETARKLDRESVDDALDMMIEAERIVIVGVDQMAFFASYLRHMLALLDLRAEIVASASQEALARLSRLDGGCMVIALSVGRVHTLVQRAMKLAKRRGCRTLSISDSTLSEAAKAADVKLYYSSDGPSFTPSHAALMSVVQGLAFGVYSRDETGFKGRIRAYRLQ